jgi:flagellar hook-associated protein 1 FlgK
MASTFGLLNTAASGIQAARAGMDVVGQNIANVNTDGYTRQRVVTSAAPALSGANVLDSNFRVGSGVVIGGTQRLGDLLLERRVQGAMAEQADASLRTRILSGLEDVLAEPSDDGFSAALAQFWGAWQEVAAKPTSSEVRGVLLEEARGLVSRIAEGATRAEDTWSAVRADLVAAVREVDELADRFADLNVRIADLSAAGGSINELLDERARLAGELSALTGATLRPHDDGTADVVLDGIALVSGDTVRRLDVSGAITVADAAGDPVTVGWSHHPGVGPRLGGELGARLALLAPAADGGPIAAQVDAFDRVAVALATAVNAVHVTGATQDGTTGLDFFSFAAGLSPAHGLRLVPTGVDGIAAATPGTGGAGGQVADAIARLADAPGGPDALWVEYVADLGTASRAAATRGALAERALAGSVAARDGEQSVDIDEETVALMTFQHAYQGAARVMTAVDEMLDVLINRMGLVGR